MLDFFAEMCLEWYRAESDLDPFHVAFPPIESLTVGQVIEIAGEHVKDVLTGEKRWSECQPGDRAIWNGRAQGRQDFLEKWLRYSQVSDEVKELPVDGLQQRIENIKARVATVRYGDQHPVANREPYWWKFYDTAIVGDTYSWRAFDNKNVGNMFLTNLQMAGQLAYTDQSFACARFYCTVPPETGTDWWMMENTRVELIIHNKVSTPALTLRELMLGWQVGIVIPERVNVEIRGNEHHGKPVGYGPKNQGWEQYECKPFPVVLHLEGMLTRTIY